MINDNNIVDFENEKLFSETQLSSIIFSIKREENNKKSKKIMLKGQFEEVTSVALISSNKYVVSGSKDKTIRI
jgi:WD domain, G-beta repeat.